MALGTSLPDAFASRQAALESRYADAAIGNVTGSNCVNVFLGLGLPWLIGSLYYIAKGEDYFVPAEGLSFSVAVFLGVSVLCLVTLVLRRLIFKGELGGNVYAKWASAVWLVFLWVVYLIMSSLKIYNAF